MANKYLTKIAEKLEDPNYLRMGGRGLVTAIGASTIGGFIVQFGGPLTHAAGSLGGLGLGAYHGWQESKKLQLKEQKNGR